MSAARVSSERIPLGPSLSAPPQLPEPSNTVAYFGFPSREKGYQQLVLALAGLPRDERPELLVVGADGPAGVHGFLSPEETVQFAADHGVRLHRTGYLRPARAAAALASCGVVAFPFPGGATQRSSALIATLAVGRPVVETVDLERDDLGELAALPQLRLISPGDVALLGETIRVTLTDPPSAAPLPAAYQWPTIAERHLALYRRVLGSPG